MTTTPCPYVSPSGARCLLSPGHSAARHLLPAERAEAVALPRVVLAMPSGRPIPAETTDSFAGVYGRGLTDGTVTAKIVLGDTYIDTARNLLVTYAMEAPGATHVLWLDDDMVWPADLAARLLAHEAPVVGARYHMKYPPFRPVAFDYDPDGHARPIELEDDATALRQVGGLGLGATLVRIGLYPAMAEQYGDAWWHRCSTGRGEDVHFFDRLRGMGVPVLLDPSIHCGHVRRETVGSLHYESYRRAHPNAPGESATDER